MSSPPNVLVCKPPPGRVKLLDFGIAFEAAGLQNLTQTGVILGTPAYMAPRTSRRRPRGTARADLFSLGCILYEMAAGRPPFDGPSAMSILKASRSKRPAAAVAAVAGRASGPSTFWFTRLMAKACRRPSGFRGGRGRGFASDRDRRSPDLRRRFRSRPCASRRRNDHADRRFSWPALPCRSFWAALLAGLWFLARQLAVRRSPEWGRCRRSCSA